MRNCLKGYKSICNVPSFIFIHFLAMRLVRLKYRTTEATEANIKAQEVGLISLTRFQVGDFSFGILNKCSQLP